MASNLNKLTKIANYFDQKGKYALADEVENLIKTSQNLLPTLPGEYEATGAPRTGNPFIDGLFTNMSDSAAGSMFAGGDMYDRFSPYKSKYGPEGPSVLPTLTPMQFAELSKTEKGRKYLAQMQLSSGNKAQNFMNQSNVGFKSFGKFISQNLDPSVAQERRQEFVNNVLPGTISTQVSNLLTKFPIYEWQPRLNEFFMVANSVPDYSSQLKNMINQSVKSALQNLKYQDAKQYAKIVKDPKYNSFSSKYGVT
jgi:hypothetical protein